MSTIYLQEFCLRWNCHQENVVSFFHDLLRNETHADCTLAAGGQYLKAHKLVLCASSPYLESLLNQHMDKHPILIFKDIEFPHLKSMLEYMYNGEVKIIQNELNNFFKAAESLQIKGLSWCEDADTCSSLNVTPQLKSTSIQRIKPKSFSKISALKNSTIKDFSISDSNIKVVFQNSDTSRNEQNPPVAKKRKAEVLNEENGLNLLHGLVDQISVDDTEQDPLAENKICKIEVDSPAVFGGLLKQSKDTNILDHGDQVLTGTTKEADEEVVVALVEEEHDDDCDFDDYDDEANDDDNNDDNESDAEFIDFGTNVDSVTYYDLEEENLISEAVVCPYCGENFLSLKDIYSHCKSCKHIGRPDKSYRCFCFICNYHTNSKSNMVRHLKYKHFKDHNFKDKCLPVVRSCPYCNLKNLQTFDVILQHSLSCEEVERPDNSYKYYCVLCDYHTISRPNMRRHIDRWHVNMGEKKERSKNKSDWKTLEGDVSDEEESNVVKITCSYCNRECSETLKGILRHCKCCEKVERPDKNYTYFCFLCEYHTNLSYRMKRHISRKHIKDNIYKCIYCSFNTYEKTSLSNHLENNHKMTIVNME